MNEMLVLATLAARQVIALEGELAAMRSENADLRAQLGPQEVAAPKPNQGDADGTQPVS